MLCEKELNMAMPPKKAAWRLQGLIGQLKSLRKQGVLTLKQEIAALRPLQDALKIQQFNISSPSPKPD